ncbi:uncharacterized protein LOC107198402 [Parus major]|uniref:uncharacterized protein LOC107198402 n=1 Tax=Parus major TaxID=9157 RepID=UPI00144412F3|nr:uncharacterized protein LOC107198402 [Parus major]
MDLQEAIFVLFLFHFVGGIKDFLQGNYLQFLGCKHLEMYATIQKQESLIKRKESSTMVKILIKGKKPTTPIRVSLPAVTQLTHSSLIAASHPSTLPSPPVPSLRALRWAPTTSAIITPYPTSAHYLERKRIQTDNFKKREISPYPLCNFFSSLNTTYIYYKTGLNPRGTINYSKDHMLRQEQFTGNNSEGMTLLPCVLFYISQVWKRQN